MSVQMRGKCKDNSHFMIGVICVSQNVSGPKCPNIKHTKLYLY